MNAPLDDGPEGLKGRTSSLFHQLRVPLFTAIQPAEGSLHAFVSRREGRLPRHDMIESHRDIGAQLPLDIDRTLGRKHPECAVDMALELDTMLLYSTQAL
jgi:hypothetical protein